MKTQNLIIMVKEQKTFQVKKLENYLNDEILMAKSGLAFWNRRGGNEDQASMLKYWKTVNDTLVKCKKDLLGNDSVIPEIAANKKAQSIVLHTPYPEGTPEHQKHYIAEFDRIKLLAHHATGELAELLFTELDGIRLILESYEP